MSAELTFHSEVSYCWKCHFFDSGDARLLLDLRSHNLAQSGIADASDSRRNGFSIFLKMDMSAIPSADSCAQSFLRNVGGKLALLTPGNQQDVSEAFVAACNAWGLIERFLRQGCSHAHAGCAAQAPHG